MHEINKRLIVGTWIVRRKEAERLLVRYKMTDFQRSVLIATASIARGKTATYGDIARMIGNPGAYRTVGTALAKNPLPITIPCHRVVRADGIGRYSGRGGSSAKLRLLKSEGAVGKERRGAVRRRRL